MIFPPKKFQVRFTIFGAGIGVTGGLLAILLLNSCFADESTALCYIATFMTSVFMYLPTITIGKICAALYPTFACLLLSPVLFFTIIFYIFGNIFWMLKNRKNKI